MGAAVKVTRDDMTAGDLRKASGRVKDGKVARRLLAIALVLEGVSCLERWRLRAAGWTGKRCAIGFIGTMRKGLKGSPIEAAAA